MSISRKGRRVIAGGVAVALLAGGMLASATSATAASKAGGTLILVTKDPSLETDPTRVYVGQTIAFQNAFYVRNLVSYVHAAGAKGSGLIGDLATTTGKVSKDGKTWTFTLRKGVKWEDGKAVTCADVKYGVSRTFAQDVLPDGPTYAIDMLDIPVDADGNSVYAGPYKKAGQAAYDKAVTCSKDNQTVTFHLKRPVYDFNYTLTYPSFSPVRKDKDTGEKYRQHPYSTGPYKFKKFVEKDELVLVRNPFWSKASDPVHQAYPDEIDVKFGLNETVRDQIFIQDSIPNAVMMDALLPTSRTAVFGNDAAKNRRMNVWDPYVTYMFINQKTVPCLDIRQALFYARDLEGQIKLAGGTEFGGDYADGVIKPSMGIDYKPVKNSTNSADGKTRNLNPNWKPGGNPAYAQTFMDAAKKSCPDVYARATGAGLNIIMRKSGVSDQITQIWNAAMAKVGIKLNWTWWAQSGAAYYSHVRSVDNMDKYDLTYGGWAPDWANASTVIPEIYMEGHGAPYGHTWASPAYDAFAKRAEANLKQTNRAKQGAEWAALNQYASDQKWVLPSFFTKTQLVWGSNIGGAYFWEPQGTFGFGELYVKQ